MFTQFLERIIDFDRWREILDSIRRHKLRTILSSLGVFWGIFVLVILLGSGKGLQNGVEDNFRNRATNSVWFYGGSTSKSHKGLPAGRRILLSNEDYELLFRELDGIEYLAGRYYLRGEFSIVRGKKSFVYMVRCVHPDYQKIEHTIMTSGRYVNQKDLEENRKVAVIGRLVKEALFEEHENAIGEHIKISGIDFEVVGIFEDEGNDSEMRIVHLPIKTAQRVFGGERDQSRIHSMAFTTGDATMEEAAEMEKIAYQKLANLHNFAPDDNQAIYVRNDLENFKKFRDFFGFINIFMWIVGIGTLIAGIVGISNIMLIVVKDRTKEIGVRKALGATPISIVQMIVQEAIFVTAIGGYLGMLCGIMLISFVDNLIVTNDLDNQFFKNPTIDFSVVLWALFILVFSGALAGLIPAIKAARINPVKAMKM